MRSLLSHSSLRHHAAQSGFTLVELAVVLLISSIIAAASFTLGTAWIEAEEYNAAKRQMTAIENAFETYRRMNLRLPCPAAPVATDPEDRGVEGGSGPALCTTGGDPAFSAGSNMVYGAVPVRALGLPVALMRDPWGNMYMYYVDQRATAEGAFDITSRQPEDPVAEESTYIDPNCDNGNGTIYNDDDTEGDCSALPADAIGALEIRGAGGTIRTTRAMFALLSTGANGRAEPTVGDEVQNHDGVLAGNVVSGANSVLVQRLRDFSETPAQHFDDIVVYKNRWHFREDVRPGETIGGS